jgi:hypothetical protein
MGQGSTVVNKIARLFCFGESLTHELLEIQAFDLRRNELGHRFMQYEDIW